MIKKKRIPSQRNNTQKQPECPEEHTYTEWAVILQQKYSGTGRKRVRRKAASGLRIEKRMSFG